jgi:c-di-GMP-related signal transduction protein
VEKVKFHTQNFRLGKSLIVEEFVQKMWNILFREAGKKCTVNFTKTKLNVKSECHSL